jgi:hypothetical protein
LNKSASPETLEGVGEAVAEVQACCVPTFLEIGPSLASGMRVFLSDRLDADGRAPEE